MESLIIQLLEKAINFNANKQYESVLKLLPDDLLTKLNNADLWGKKAHAYWRLGKFVFCDDAITNAMKINPNQKDARY